MLVYKICLRIIDGNKVKSFRCYLTIAKLINSITILKNIQHSILSSSKIASTIPFYINSPLKDILISYDSLSNKPKKDCIRRKPNSSSKRIRISKYLYGWISKIIKDSLLFYMPASMDILISLSTSFRSGGLMTISPTTLDLTLST